MTMQPIFPILLEKAIFPTIDVVRNSEESNQSIQIIDPEFSSVCPVTGLPDFGRVILQYTPDKYVVELKSLKLYYRAYYGVGIMHEPVTSKILSDFVEAINPLKAQVVIDWGARGGLKTVTGLAWDHNSKFERKVWYSGEVYASAQTDWTNC